ncbi:Dosage compensation protein dpy-30 [Diplonema papillatum]|nr:Dosage compensation protein dpy-30 [Diplonema papillatum]
MEVPPALLQLFDDQEEARRALKAAAAPIEPATLSSLPAQAYLEATVIPILLQGLDALAVARVNPEEKRRPQDPLDFLAAFLLENNPQKTQT